MKRNKYFHAEDVFVSRFISLRTALVKLYFYEASSIVFKLKYVLLVCYKVIDALYEFSKQKQFYSNYYLEIRSRVDEQQAR